MTPFLIPAIFTLALITFNDVGVLGASVPNTSVCSENSSGDDLKECRGSEPKRGSSEGSTGGSLQPDDADEQDCQDLHENCPLWAQDGECSMNPRYMTSACRSSCLLCVSKEDRQELEPSFLRIKEVFSTMDLGVEQHLPTEPKKTNLGVKQVLKRMDHYSKSKVTHPAMSGIRHLCKNSHKNCATWAFEGKCVSDPIFMMESCSLACRLCHFLDSFHRCYVANNNPQEMSEKDQSIFPNQESISSVFQHLETNHNATILSRGGGGESEDLETNPLPWLATIESFLPSDLCHDLVHLGDSGILHWKLWKSNPETERFHKHQFWYAKFNESSAPSEEDILQKDESSKIYSLVMNRILDLMSSSGAGWKHTTYLGLQRFQKMQSHAPTYSYRVQEEWKPAGPRILTIIICLQESSEGGNLGFPELDWLFLDLKQGQAMIWSNVDIAHAVKEKDSDDDFENRDNKSKTLRKLEKMQHEVLPVVEGEERFAVLHIHALDWKGAYEDDCT